MICLKTLLLRQQPSQPQKSVAAGPHAADVIAEGVELANPAAAAIAVVVVTVVAGGDGGADNRGADEAGSNAPAERPGLRLGGGCDRAGYGKGGGSESGELCLYRHGSLPPVLRGPCGPHAQVGGAWLKAGRK